MSPLTTRLTYSALAALIPSASLAADTDRMVITGSRQLESIDRIPANIQVLGGDEIKQIWGPGDNLSTVLGKLVPGLGAPTNSVSNFGQTLRGRKILLVIDGVPQTENRQVSRQLNSLQTKAIERIEVVSGANAVYGPEATGGIIHVITRSPEAGLESISSIGASASEQNVGDSAAYSASQTISGKAARTAYLIDFNYEQRQKNFDGNGDPIAPEPAQVGRLDTRSIDASLKLSYDLSTETTLSLAARAFDEQQDTDQVVQSQPYRSEGGLDLDDQPFSKSIQGSVRLESVLLGQELDLNLYTRSREYRFYPFNFNVLGLFDLTNQSTSKSDVLGAKLTVHSPVSDSASLTWGLDWEQEQGEQTAVAYDSQAYAQSGGRAFEGQTGTYDYGPAVETEKAAAFLQGQWSPRSDLHVRAGARYETITQKVDDFVSPYESAFSRNWGNILAVAQQLEDANRIPAGTTNLLPESYKISGQSGDTLQYDGNAFNLGFVFDINPTQQIYVNGTQGYELADTARILRDSLAEDSQALTLARLFGAELTSTGTDDLDLEVIKTNSLELGWRGRGNGLSYGINGFYNESDKTYQFNPDFSVSLLSSTKRIYGGDLFIDGQIVDRVQGGLSLSYTRGEVEQEEAEGNGWDTVSPIEATPPKVLAYSAYRYLPNHQVRAQVMHLFASDKVADNEFVSEAYTLLDLFFRSDISPAQSLSLGIHNAANTQYQSLFNQWAEATYGEASGAPGHGRRFSLNYTLSL
ncbi:TonB-dependent receptor [Pseudobacteriovorax antillogorgiicola]|uniref:Iron complex outermembrane recepter protein n=1 Tax=Pseudobacteriovorax antillogorgiicola TaxID=1513793 RepID=A0A1Y6CNL6_9BACT|nr:TonB-dependent receptor [Pseudobacteriovorax antillogorgiicola]TCS43613.1 iron complex outermembrane receptor protein [Pseudobacteriovorax antillogorgiicola]SMF80068.1 iron complex outermembrane recepter protein [Pseudobacteriovorax antillogorgiicola]